MLATESPAAGYGAAKPKLLIIDELGYLPLEPDAAHLFFQLVIRRYETVAMLITSNRGVAEASWCSPIRWSQPQSSTAFCITATLTMSGDSYRLRAKRKSGLIKHAVGDGPPVGSALLATNLQPRP